MLLCGHFLLSFLATHNRKRSNYQQPPSMITKPLIFTCHVPHSNWYKAHLPCHVSTSLHSKKVKTTCQTKLFVPTEAKVRLVSLEAKKETNSLFVWWFKLFHH